MFPRPALPLVILVLTSTLAHADWLSESSRLSEQVQISEEDPNFILQYGGIARGYYSNDQRIEWTGQEATFGAEGVGFAKLGRYEGDWSVGLTTELYLNQPYDGNILIDGPERASFEANFRDETVELSQLGLWFETANCRFQLGKIVTPFGRHYARLYQNSRADAPFIRSEAILWRETGFSAETQRGIFNLTAAVTNGGGNRDANSSKAFIGRIGVQQEFYTLGASIKWQDGIGSENQKMYNNHFGIDGMVRYGVFRLSCEVIYDEYGFRHDYDPLTIYWGRSIYNREINGTARQPKAGSGYYVTLEADFQMFYLVTSYGQYFPEIIGDHIQDQTTTRAIFKAAYRILPAAEAYSELILENDVSNAQADRTRRGIMYVLGFQLAL